MIRRSVAILLILWFAALGAGVLEYLHNLQHEAEDARAAAIAGESQSPDQAPDHPIHDDTNCAIHAQLHMALFLSCWAPLLVRLGIFIALVSLLARPLIHRLLPLRIKCRGPPIA